MPFMGPVGASRVGFIKGKYVLNPSKKELEELLKIAVQNENYESAAKIRDEISNR